MKTAKLATTFGIIALAALLVPTSPALAKRAKVGELAPDFELTLFNKQKVRLSELRGKVIVLNFWATWCVPCKRELPLLDAYYTLSKKHGFEVFAITTEGSISNERLKPLFALLKIQPVRWIRGNYSDLGGVPTNYVIDRSGRLRYAQAGALELDDLNRILIPLLNEKAPVE